MRSLEFARNSNHTQIQSSPGLFFNFVVVKKNRPGNEARKVYGIVKNHYE